MQQNWLSSLLEEFLKKNSQKVFAENIQSESYLFQEKSRI